jgi:excisionase family DNA binding protein
MSKQVAENHTPARIGRPPNPTAVFIAARKRAYSIKEAARELAISVPQVYVMLGRGELTGKKLGGRTVILGDELDRYLFSLPDAVISAPISDRRAEEARAAQSK